MAKNDETTTTLSPEAFDAFEEKLDAPACPTPGLVDAMRRSRKTFGLADPETLPSADAQED